MEVKIMTTIITARVDSDDKQSFEDFCNSIGLTASSVINMFIKTVIRDWEIPFKVKADPFFGENNQALLRKNAEEMDETGNIIHNLFLDERK